MIALLLPAVLTVFIVFSGCDSNSPSVNLQTITVSDIPADPATGYDPNTGQPIGTNGKYTFYSLRENKIILSDTEPNRADSTSNKWDIAFHSSTILINGSGVGGGQGGGQVMQTAFSAVTQAPSTGYTTDPIGLEGSSAVAWGKYDAAAMIVVPLSDHTLVIKTGDGQSYAKVKIVSYYKGNPQPPTATDQARYYTFQYVLQTNGRNFQ